MFSASGVQAFAIRRDTAVNGSAAGRRPRRPHAGVTVALGILASFLAALGVVGSSGAVDAVWTSFPEDIVAEATSAAGAVVTYKLPTATYQENPMAVACDPLSGSTFPLGSGAVTCTATFRITAMRSFKVTVSDTTPPTLTVPANFTVEATGPSGATVNFQVSATDIVDGTDRVGCGRQSGTTFPLGTTGVKCAATDAAGNSTSDAFAVTVSDTTPPALSVPADITVQAAGGASTAPVSFTASATDVVDGTDPVTCDHVSGSSFAVGTTTVTCSARDKAGNGASKSFMIAVKPGTVTTTAGGDTSSTSTTTSTTTSTASTAKTTTVATTTTPRGAPVPPSPLPIVDEGQPRLPDQFPPSTPAVSIDVSGNGTVVSSLRGVQGVASAARPIVCGTSGFLCYARFSAKQKLQFVAKPDPGYRFANWGGACFGQGATCTLTVGPGRSVDANFASTDPEGTASVTLDEPRISIRWHRSVGSGELTVHGSVSKPALVRLEFRRPAGGQLIVQQESIPAGTFQLAPQISRAALPKGALVLPGGFVVVLTGRVGSANLPQALRTVVLPPPPEGVVRRAYTARTAGGPASPHLLHGTKAAYATFVFASQPRRGEKLSVRWFSPAGKLVGSRSESNRPTVQTSVRSNAPIQRGRWRVELRAGRTVISTHTVDIG